LRSSRRLRGTRCCASTAGTWIQEDDLSFEINEPDAYALEEALQLKEKNGGEWWPFAPVRAGGADIREALARARPGHHIEEGTADAIRFGGAADGRAVGPRSPT